MNRLEPRKAYRGRIEEYLLNLPERILSINDGKRALPRKTTALPLTRKKPRRFPPFPE